MGPNFSTSNISMREVIITWILEQFNKKSPFFEGWSWFNNLRLTLDTKREILQ